MNIHSTTMTLRSFTKLDPWMYQIQTCYKKRGNDCIIVPFGLKFLKECKTGHPKHFSSHIVESPFPKIDIPQIVIPDLMGDIVNRFPEETALKCGVTGRSYKFAEVQKLSHRFMNSLIKAGFSNRDVIAIVLPNCPEFGIATLGALEANMVVALINHTYTPGEILYHLKDSGAVCILCGVNKLTVIHAAIAKLEKTQPNPIRKIIAMDVSTSESLPEGVARFSEAIADNVDHSKKTSVTLTPKDLALMPYSSGTRGLAKGVCLSHRNIVSAVSQIDAAKKIYGPDKNQDISIGLLPFFHIYGLIALMLNTLIRGGQIVTLPSFHPKTFIHTLENEKVSILLLVPPLVKFLGAHPLISSKKHLSHVRFVLSGADLLEVTDLERLKAKLPPDAIAVQGYGMTELSTLGTFPTLPPKNLATCGAPVANTQAKITSSEGRNLGPYETGELCFRGPQVMKRFHNDPKSTADMIDASGWLHTGDIGHYDENNHFYIEGRLKEMIKVKGFQVAPVELEKVLKSLSGVKDVGVIGVPNPQTGDTPVAYVVRDKGSTLTEDHLKDFLSKNVAKHKQVSRVFFVDQIPRSTSGKILRRELQQMFQDSQK